MIRARPRKAAPRGASLALVVLLAGILLAPVPGGLAAPGPFRAGSGPGPPPLSGNWSAVAGVGPNPGGMSEFGFAWIPKSVGPGYALLFGGRTGPSTLSNATWEFQGGRWTQLFPSVHPPALRGPMMAYDPALGEVVLFGGSNATAYLNETWTFRAGNWTELNLSRAPEGRRVGGFAYDANEKALLLFGGHSVLSSGRYRFFGDTWRFGTAGWHRVRAGTSPSPRAEPSMAFDPALKGVVLFGGYARVSRAYHAYNDTWLYRQGNWTALATVGAPSARDGAAIAFDPAVRAVVLEGGHNGTAQRNDTWAIRIVTGAPAWSRVVTPQGIPVGAAASMIYDPAALGLVLYGGTPDGKPQVWYNQTWEIAPA